jgi:hypothetical protein
MAVLHNSLVVAGRDESGQGVIAVGTLRGRWRFERLGGIRVLSLCATGERLFLAGTEKHPGSPRGKRAVVGILDGLKPFWWPITGTRLAWDVAGNEHDVVALVEGTEGSPSLAYFRDYRVGSKQAAEVLEVPPGLTPIHAGATSKFTFTLARESPTNFPIVLRISPSGFKEEAVLFPPLSKLVDEEDLRAASAVDRNQLLLLLSFAFLLASALLLLSRSGPRPSRWKQAQAPLFEGPFKDELLVGLAAKAEWEKSVVMRRAIYLLLIAIVFVALGILLFLGVLSEGYPYLQAGTDGAVYAYTRALGILVFFQIIALYLVKRFGEALGDYRFFYKSFLRRTDIVEAQRLLANASFEIGPEQERLVTALLENTSMLDGQGPQLAKSELEISLREVIEAIRQLRAR